MREPIFSPQLISPQTTPYLYSERDAVTFLRTARWENGVCCPRCGSTDVRQVETDRVLEALSCRACRYNFTTAADTYFHASRIPLHEHLQFILALELEPDSAASRLARSLGWKQTTVERQRKRLRAVGGEKFVRRLGNYQTFENFARTTDYLEQPTIELSLAGFRQRLGQLMAPLGRKLRRKPRLKPSKTSLSAKALETTAEPPKGVAVVSPSTLRYFNDQDTAYDLIVSLRWDKNMKECPRCNSRLVYPVKGSTPRDLYRCGDCRYIFNSLSGTIFQGAKMPIPKYLQFFVLDNALDDALRMQDICDVMECTFKTAAIWRNRGQTFKSSERFAYIKRQPVGSVNPEITQGERRSDPFGSFCRRKGIVVCEAHFLEFAKRVCRSPIPIVGA